MVQKIIRQPTGLLQQREGKTTDLGATDMDSEGADQPQSSSYDEPLSKKGELEESKKQFQEPDSQTSMAPTKNTTRGLLIENSQDGGT